MEERVVRIGARAMAAKNLELTYEQHESYVRAVLAAVDGEMVLRCLYDGVVSQLRHPGKPRGMDS